MAGTVVVAALLAACSSTAPPAGRGGTPRQPAPMPPSSWPATDGPEANPPPDLHLVPDAEPRIEPVRPGGPNKSYAVAAAATARRRSRRPCWLAC